MVRSLASLALGLVATFSPGIAQHRCAPEKRNEWLTSAPKDFVGKKVSPELVMPVTADLGRAVSMLEPRSAVPITEADVVSFAGSAPSHLPELRPFLVRAVDVHRSTGLTVSVEKGRLEVFAGNLGCPFHLKTPIIVFLREPPKQVVVEAMAAL